MITSMMLQGAGAGPSMGHPRIEALPVFRHGGEAARICDEALSVMGPTDSRISRCVCVCVVVTMQCWRG